MGGFYRRPATGGFRHAAAQTTPSRPRRESLREGVKGELLTNYPVLTSTWSGLAEPPSHTEGTRRTRCLRCRTRTRGSNVDAETKRLKGTVREERLM